MQGCRIRRLLERFRVEVDRTERIPSSNSVPLSELGLIPSCRELASVTRASPRALSVFVSICLSASLPLCLSASLPLCLSEKIFGQLPQIATGWGTKRFYGWGHPSERIVVGELRAAPSSAEPARLGQQMTVATWRLAIVNITKYSGYSSIGM